MSLSSQDADMLLQNTEFIVKQRHMSRWMLTDMTELWLRITHFSVVLCLNLNNECRFKVIQYKSKMFKST